MKQSIRLAVILGAVFVAAQAVNAEDVIFSQIDGSGGAFSSRDTPDGQKVADNFSFTGDSPVVARSLRVLGGYGPPDAMPTDAFRVTFLADNAGEPGAILSGGDLAIGSAVSRNPTGGPLLSGVTTPLEFVLDLGQGVVLNPSTDYWISITNENGADAGWAWARAESAFDPIFASTTSSVSSGPWDLFDNGGMYFEISKVAVPEPNTLVGLGLALAFQVAAIRCR